MLFSPKHILVPVAVDSDQELALAEHAMLVACDIAVKFSSHITLLHLEPLAQAGAALDPTGEIYRNIAKTLEARLKKSTSKVSALKGIAKSHGVHTSARVLDSLADTADAILKAVVDLK